MLEVAVSGVKRVLISAYACEPHKGSEPGVGWGWVKQITKFAEAWVITRKNNREVIEEELERNPDPNLHFIYVDLPKWMRFWKKRQRGVHVYYYFWQIAIYFVVRKVHIRKHFHLSHHLTFVNSWLPSFLFLLPIPFIWGPIGQHPKIPIIFLKYFGLRVTIYELIRTFSKKIFFHFDPFLHLCFRKAEAIIIINQHILGKNDKKYKQKTYTTPAIAIDHWFTKKDKSYTKKYLTILSVGNLLYWKGFYLTISAFGELSNRLPDSKLILIGDGKERNQLEKMVKSQGIYNRVLFAGKLLRDKVLEYMSQCDIFLYPSFEGGGMVVLEAMASGRPIVSLAYGGPGEMITEECGIKVKPITPMQTIKDLADALLKLAKEPDLRKKMGEAGKRRVEDYYNWDKKGEFIKRLYHSVLNNENIVHP
jgi:glycosyltransferase involved in cell wall biosynthesis